MSLKKLVPLKNTKWELVAMNKELMNNAVTTLTNHLNAGTEHNDIIFHKFLEAMCDTESQYYILGHLELLGDVLKERNCESLIDFIAKYDYRSAQQLDVLVMK